MKKYKIDWWLPLFITLLIVVSGTTVAQAQETEAVAETDDCAALPAYETLTATLQEVVAAGDNGGFGNEMWATLVDRDGIICVVTFSGAARGEQWPGSRIIAAQKANTVNAFGLPGLALSTANLYAGTQPGGSLYGLLESLPVDPVVAYAGPAENYGAVDDPMVGRRMGGVSVFGGGLALYAEDGTLVGGLGLSGDTSCTDHIIAWKVRDGLTLDYVPAGVTAADNDNIVFDITVSEAGVETSESGWGHPECGLGEVEIAAELPDAYPLGESTPATTDSQAPQSAPTAAAAARFVNLSPPETSATLPYTTQLVTVMGAAMAYVEAGAGDPILFLHGNPTSKYLWRNIMPWLEEQGRVIAPDLIGMGESDKPAIDYTFAEHSEYVDGFIEALDLTNITLVVHDWGSGLGLDYARRHPDNSKAIAMMEALIAPAMPITFDAMAPEQAEFFRALRTPEVGEQLILEQNFFVEQTLPDGVVRELTDAEMATYRAPYLESEDRLPTLVWPREVPINGEPADVVERVNAYNEWLLTSPVPKLHLYVAPGTLNPPAVIPFLQENMTNYEAIYVGQGLHFIQEDHPAIIGRNLANWVRRINE
ncbi:MAG: haloalkane dehalogenase [Caldilineaceae bacterium]